MPFVYSNSPASRHASTRPLVQALFVCTILLSIVSYYTTQQGMAMYLAPWFATIAALGIQVALVMVAWLVGMGRGRNPLLISVYVITAIVSIAFSYVSLHNWFASRERPAEIRRALYDNLNATAGKTDNLLAEAAVKSRQYVTALDEMTAAERQFGHVSRSGDSDPYLDSIRQNVAKEAQAMGAAYKEGSGSGVRYTAFERYTKLTQGAQREIETARRALADWRASAKPSDTAEDQLRKFRAVYDSAPWATVEQMTGRKLADRPELPKFSEYVDKSSSDQEDLMRAFTELSTAPTSRHYFALLLAAFIDVVVFLLAFASGPYFHGDKEFQWSRGAANLDAVDVQVFESGLLSKLQPSPGGMVSVALSELSPGELQFAMALAADDKATVEERDSQTYFLIDRAVQQKMLESLADAGLPLRASARKATVGA